MLKSTLKRRFFSGPGFRIRQFQPCFTKDNKKTNKAGSAGLRLIIDLQLIYY
jgi:hypothetical protein